MIDFEDADTLPTGAPRVELPTAPEAYPPDPYRSPLALDFIAARSFNAGRKATPSLVVIHTTENLCAPGVARRVASWFGGPDAPPASAHYLVGPDEIIQCVREQDTAWAAPGANSQGIHIEHTARAAFTAEQWASPEALAMLERSARLVACLCRRHSIPVLKLRPAELLEGASGIVGHVEVSKAWRRSDHYDPGAAFPWSRYLEMIEDES